MSGIPNTDVNDVDNQLQEYLTHWSPMYIGVFTSYPHIVNKRQYKCS